ncbi:MAG: hypothetical protein Q4C80_07400 [Bacillota bacterium]|nr:hypothetical protein [Bacillota bacterium]
MKTITKQEIDSLYKKIGVEGINNSPSPKMNKGTLNNKLATKFVGARRETSMKGRSK